MGAWGANSWECDDVQDELDEHWNLQGPGHRRTATGVHAIVSKMEVSNYNPTLRVGVVLALLDTEDLTVGKKTVQLAIDDLTKAMADKKYIKTWVHKQARIKALKQELTDLKRALKRQS